MYELGKRRDIGKGCDTGRGSNLGKGSDIGGDSALRAACSCAVHARLLAVADCASGFACLPNCSSALYGLSSAACLWLGSPIVLLISQPTI